MVSLVPEMCPIKRLRLKAEFRAAFGKRHFRSSFAFYSITRLSISFVTQSVRWDFINVCGSLQEQLFCTIRFGS